MIPKIETVLYPLETFARFDFGAFWISRSLGCAIRVMEHMPSLNGVSDEWEADANVRENMRRFNTILQWHDFESKKVNLKNAGLNFHSLKPLVQRLLDSKGDVGMHRLPEIMSQ